MFSENQDRATTIIWVLAFVGGITCILSPFLLTGDQMQLWPLPALYYIEVALLGILGLVSVYRAHPGAGYWSRVVWSVAGCLLAFVILGAGGLGPYLIPALVGFMGTAVLLNRKLYQSPVHGVIIFMVAAIFQAILLLVLLAFLG